MTQSSYPLDPAGSGVDSALPWVAQSVQIDNPTGQWWYIPGAGQFIGPYTIGASFSLVPASPQARIIKQTPPGVLSSSKAGESGSVTFNTLDAPDTPGFNIGNQTTITPPSNILFQYFLILGGASFVPFAPRIGFKFRITVINLNIQNTNAGVDLFTVLQDTTDGINPVNTLMNYISPGVGINNGIATYGLANDSGINQSLALSSGIRMACSAGVNIAANIGGIYIPN